MRKAKVVMLMVLVLLGAGCSRKPEVPPLLEEDKRLAKDAADAFLRLARKKSLEAEEVEKHLSSGIHPLWRPRLAFSVKQARTSPTCEWFQTDSSLTSDNRTLVNVRYEITVAGQSKVLVLYLAREEDGKYKVTGANILEKQKKK
jgi:hypothetical protein